MALKKGIASAQINAFITEGKEEEPEEVIQPIEEKPEKAAGTPSKGLLPAKTYEQKTQRVNLLLQPSIYKAAKKQAKALGYKSFNDYVNELLKAQTSAR